jgi:hypothetical protein
VVAADRDRVPPGQPLAAVGEQVGDQSHRGPRPRVSFARFSRPANVVNP